MKYNLFIAISILILGCSQNSSKENLAIEVKGNLIQLDTTYLFKADPEKGFNFDYYMYIPKNLDTSKESIILIESTNIPKSFN